MEIKSYQNQAELLVKEYLLADSVIPYTSVICGICACKMVYDLTQLFSNVYFKSYPGLSKLQRTEWSNRSISTFHAIFIAIISLYFVFWSNLYSDHEYAGPITFRSSALSTFTLGVLHHLLSVAGIANPMLTGEGQVYTFMVLISESTTPGINLRWYLDTAGMKRSRAYLINGVVMFVAWLVARILLFMYLFYHIYLHYDQVKQVNSLGQLLISIVPLVLSVMNLMWFGKIIKGLMKTLAKRH
ncbi:TLC domain-containing protein 4 B isoform X3 [Gossypium hirsutum]|uniref:TLC domain-containing protein 4 B isoform X3 n=1 Tax=Gossypium hirsutum TaxID=3635 RepID=A0ABM3B3J8_GOSHI|nr:TLC domain-containing protein 4 B-like isoform X3 [Gossypium hirsutum]XP_040961639.1 TLC domain-containing protein 4 B-like isoform X3 [Gossypium hirsutum]